MRRPPQQRWAMVRLVNEPAEKLYSATRRFDLITLLIITVAYAVLFGVMRAFQWGVLAFVLVALFVTLVGVGQAFLFHGNAPRAASMLVGGVYWSAVTLFYSGFCPCFAVGAIVWGAPLGYVCGVFIGGVFMVADWARQVLRRGTSHEAEDVDPFTPHPLDEIQP